MKKDIADRWVADLRSGPPQARGMLFDGVGYCCLGHHPVEGAVRRHVPVYVRLK